MGTHRQLVVLWAYSSGYRNIIRWLPVVALWWPISLLLSHITVVLQGGEWYVDYLARFPIFLFTDIALPAVLLATWWVLSPATAESRPGL